jgi:hypothetical protein
MIPSVTPVVWKRKPPQITFTLWGQRDARTNRSSSRPFAFEKAISELQGLQELLHSDELDPRILADFRDALNRVRNTAWAAQQYANRKASDQDSTDVLSFLARERIRATHHLCRAVNEDLKQTDIQFQRGSLIELDEITKALTQQLNSVINRLGWGLSMATPEDVPRVDTRREPLPH